MSPENEEKLLAAAPQLYTGFKWGFAVGDGWFDLLYRLSCRIEAEINRLNNDNIRAAQVKEKFAGLRFYMTGTTEEISKAIDEAEAESERTCDQCGAPGELYGTKFWLYRRCQLHDVSWRGEKLTRRSE